MSEGVRFTKMSGAGNDFVVLAGEEAERVGSSLRSWVRRVCRRAISIGADGVLVVTPVGRDRCRVAFYNPDGASAFCGNGTRCAARFARERGYVSDRMVLDTAAGEVPAEVRGAVVRLTLPPPTDEGDATLRAVTREIRGRIVRAGVPHFVVPVDEVGAEPLEEIGPALRAHPHFGSEGTNVDLLASRDDGGWDIRTWERGVEGETLCCGTGAVAAAVVARGRGSAEEVRIVPASGSPLTVTLPGAPGAWGYALLAGEARIVYEGVLGPEGRG